jgi:hypothetical protein
VSINGELVDKLNAQKHYKASSASAYFAGFGTRGLEVVSPKTAQRHIKSKLSFKPGAEEGD